MNKKSIRVMNNLSVYYLQLLSDFSQFKIQFYWILMGLTHSAYSYKKNYIHSASWASGQPDTWCWGWDELMMNISWKYLQWLQRHELVSYINMKHLYGFIFSTSKQLSINIPFTWSGKIKSSGSRITTESKLRWYKPFLYQFHTIKTISLIYRIHNRMETLKN